MAYDAMTIANYFIRLAATENREMSLARLHKLIYFSHGWHLALYGDNLVDETFLAGELGPELASLNREFNGNGGEPSFDLARVYAYRYGDEVELNTVENPRLEDLLYRTWEIYLPLKDNHVASLTVFENSPWDKARRAHPDMVMPPLSGEDIRRYFRHVIEEETSNEKLA